MAKLWQLADDVETYGHQANWWIVVDSSGERELSGAYEQPWVAQAFLDGYNKGLKDAESRAARTSEHN